MTPLDKILDRLDKVRQSNGSYMALCPEHGDTNPSLSITEENGKILVHCFVGCETEAVLAAINLDLRDLFTDTSPRVVDEPDQPKVVKAIKAGWERVHEYLDASGNATHAQVVYRLSDGDKYVLPYTKTDGGYFQAWIGPRWLYRLPELLASTGTRFWLEGEKDVDTAYRIGLTGATTNPFGSLSSTHRDLDVSPLEDSELVVVIGDRDDAGRKFATKTVAMLQERGIRTKSVDLPVDEGQDFTDWVDTGATVADLLDLVEHAGIEAPVNVSRFDLGGVVFDTPETPESIWGDAEQSLWARGEGCMLYAGTGIGKTTIAQKVALAAIGIGKPNVLGYGVHPIEGRVLYIAADRPRQAMRSLRRMVTPDDRQRLDDRWRWETKRRVRITPEHPETLREIAVEAQAEIVIIDSVKDVVPKVSSDEAGGAYNDAMQLCIVEGIDVLSLHHPRKATADGRGALTLDDVYGSTWVTAGQGSVIALNGKPGQAVAKLMHLKQPADEVRPFDVSFDYATGELATIGHRDILDYLATIRRPVNTAQVTQFVTGKNQYSSAEKKHTERRLNALAKQGAITKEGSGKGIVVLWSPTVTFLSEEGHAKDTQKDNKKDTVGHDLPDPF